MNCLFHSNMKSLLLLHFLNLGRDLMIYIYIYIYLVLANEELYCLLTCSVGQVKRLLIWLRCGKRGGVGWKSYFALLLLWVRIWFSVILEGESWFKKTTERQGASQGFQVERRLLNICSGVPDRVWYTPHFTPCCLPHPTDVKDQRNKMVFLQKKKRI